MFCIILRCQKLTDICTKMNALYTEHSVTEISRERLAEIQKVLQVKSLTEKGKERKSRLVEKLIEQREKFVLIANHYVSVLPLLKSFVCILQAKNTNIHRIHDLMVDNLKSFFGCFVKYESITNLTSSQLKFFDLESNVRRMKSFYVRQKNHELIEKNVESFLNSFYKILPLQIILTR